MIYFIPAWGNGYMQGSNTDEMIGPIRSFMETSEDYKVIISELLPELRYFLHRFDLLESNFISIYDILQGSTSLGQKKVTFSDLDFPTDAYFIYTPFNLLVYQGEKCIGSVTLGEGSQILEATKFLEGERSISNIYDDRGFLSMRKNFEGTRHSYTEVLDVDGKWIYRVYQPEGYCKVNAQNTKALLKGTYESQKSLEFEVLNNLLGQISKQDALILSVSNNNINQLKKSPFLRQMTLSFFQERFDFEREDAKANLRELLYHAKGMTLDLQTSIKKVRTATPQDVQEKIHHLTPYDTRFELSISQELKKEVLYVEARKLKWSNLNLIVEILLEYVKTTLLKEENLRAFRIVIRVASDEEKRRLSEVINGHLFELFPKELEILEKLPVSPQGEIIVEDEKLIKQYPLLTRCLSIKSAWDIQVIQNEAEIFKQIHLTRLVIDLSDRPDLFTQVAGISAGIPQINRVKSEYVKHHKNGLIIEDISELSLGLEYYLETLLHWQEARAYSAQKIKEFSGIELRDKLCKIVGRQV